MSDRLEEIKAVYADFVPMPESVVWLIAEVERLRGESLSEVSDSKIANELRRRGHTSGLTGELRGALQALVDALDALEIYSPDTPSAVSVVTRLTAARAVAVAVLTGQEPT